MNRSPMIKRWDACGFYEFELEGTDYPKWAEEAETFVDIGQVRRLFNSHGYVLTIRKFIPGVGFRLVFSLYERSEEPSPVVGNGMIGDDYIADTIEVKGKIKA